MVLILWSGMPGPDRSSGRKGPIILDNDDFRTDLLQEQCYTLPEKPKPPKEKKMNSMKICMVKVTKMKIPISSQK